MAKKRKDDILHIKDAVWYRCDDSYTHYCCDCMMAHQKEVKLENGVLWERWIRKDRLTKKQREEENITVTKGGEPVT